jgi:hypothetical protein
MNKWPRKLPQLSLVLALIFGALTPIPASASVVQNCEGNDCTVTFAFSGEMNTFTPPQNARNLTFEIFGAQGGKSGGGGGQVTGSLVEVPDVLYIFVGGAGKTGNSVPGGFNGGGVAGFGSAMEGSGGGATDIRTGLELSSRIAVAGGGGARGAGLGSGGGSGGGLIALAGRTAQGFGGDGGSQEQGGVGGAPNGTGTAGLQGSLGVGGTGGSSSLFGGGGGGGGYYGGGGGGSDTDSCCTDAGGGGGGSSFTDATLVTNVVHSQGVWPGSGQAVIRYQLAPMVTSITHLVTEDQVSFDVEFSESVSGFEVSDLEISHSAGSCLGIDLSGSGQNYQLLLSECDDGEIFVSVKSDSVLGSSVLGPVESFSSDTASVDTFVPEPASPEPSNTEPEVLETVPEPEPVSTEEPEVPPATEGEPEVSDDPAAIPEEFTPDERSDLPDEAPGSEVSEPATPVELDTPEQIPSESERVPERVEAVEEPDKSTEDEEQVSAGIFISPPASSLPQASQTLIVPSQSGASGFGSNSLSYGLLAIGLFALGAGLVVARRGIPGVLTS